MAWKRTYVGSVLKDKDDETKSYIKIKEDCSLKKGDCLNVESKKDQLVSLEEAITNGKITEEFGVKLREGIEKRFPEFVRFEIVRVQRTE